MKKIAICLSMLFLGVPCLAINNSLCAINNSDTNQLYVQVATIFCGTFLINNDGKTHCLPISAACQTNNLVQVFLQGGDGSPICQTGLNLATPNSVTMYNDKKTPSGYNCYFN